MSLKIGSIKSVIKQDHTTPQDWETYIAYVTYEGTLEY